MVDTDSPQQLSFILFLIFGGVIGLSLGSIPFLLKKGNWRYYFTAAILSLIPIATFGTMYALILTFHSFALRNSWAYVAMILIGGWPLYVFFAYYIYKRRSPRM